MSPAPPSTPEPPAVGEAPATPGALTALESLLGESAIPSALTDDGGALRWVNAAMRDLGAVVPVARPGAAAGLDELLQMAERWGSVLNLPSCPQRWFRHVVVPVRSDDRGGGRPLHLHMLLECTAEVSAERDRQRREVYLARAADDSADAIVTLDTEGRIRYWNKGAERMFGYTAVEVIGSAYEVLVPEELKREGELDRIGEILAHQGALRNFETVRLARGGRAVEVDITVTQLLEPGGEVLGRSVIYRDISLRHRLEAEVRDHLGRLEAMKTELSRKVDELRLVNAKLRGNQKRLLAMEKLSAVGEMAARLAHEIRTPLVTIGGFSHNLWKSMPVDAPQRQYLEIIRDEVRKLERIVTEILEYVRPARIETASCHVSELVEEALAPYASQLEAAGIVVERRLGIDLPRVSVDRYQLRQVLSNLIVNAMQALEGVARDKRRLVLATDAGENHVRISIGDTGVGIPERHRSRIFRPFFTTKPSGSGLGLPISAQIAVVHRATLTFESVEGEGSTFHLRLPVGAPPGGGRKRSAS